MFAWSVEKITFEADKLVVETVENAPRGANNKFVDTVERNAVLTIKFVVEKEDAKIDVALMTPTEIVFKNKEETNPIFAVKFIVEKRIPEAAFAKIVLVLKLERKRLFACNVFTIKLFVAMEEKVAKLAKAFTEENDETNPNPASIYLEDKVEINP